MASSQAQVIVESGFSKVIAVLFEYDTPKIVHIKNKTVGIINRVIQLGILAYIIGYVIVYEKGYQDTDVPATLALTKVKGVSYTNRVEPSGNYNRIWDVADYVVPPEESDACFVTTNMVISKEQTQGTCPEDSHMFDVYCNDTLPCTEGTPVANGNGVRTGVCDNDTNTCEIYAWCPVEVDIAPDPAILMDAENFTVLIKNWIEFPKFGVKRRNIIDDIDDHDYLTTCRYNGNHPVDKFCPIFEIGVITREAGVANFSDIALKGGVIAVTIQWDCNLDFDYSYCVPKYGFRRLDDANANIAPGWNFRYANYYYMNNKQYRDLIKAYGIRITIEVSGAAGKFSIIPLLLNFGAGIGLLAVATVLCDIIALYVLKKGEFYQQKKFLMVNDPAGDAKPLICGEMGATASTEVEDERAPVNRRRTGNGGEYGVFENSSDR